jgi:hypothetical protein
VEMIDSSEEHSSEANGISATIAYWAEEIGERQELIWWIGPMRCSSNPPCGQP